MILIAHDAQEKYLPSLHVKIGMFEGSELKVLNWKEK